ncbi:MAG: AIR synthase related protein [Rhodopseudomonas palustris]|nr:AIR synthase related protein [Rhodopseudomonas palustris]
MDDRELLNVVMGIVGKEKCLDDCAEVPCGDQVMVVTTDMLHRTTDFVEGMSDWQMGWMSAAVTLSDIASMGAEPKYLLIAVGLDTWQNLAGVMQGAKDCCTRFGAEIIGGDIDRHGELTVVTTGLGLVDKTSYCASDRCTTGGSCLYHRTPGQRHRHILTDTTNLKRRSLNHNQESGQGSIWAGLVLVQ